MADNNDIYSRPFSFPEIEENGRQYQGFRKGIYPFPCDEVRPWSKVGGLALSD